MNLRLTISPEAVRDAMPPDRVLLDAAARGMVVAAAAIILAAVAAVAAPSALTKSQAAFFENRRIAVARDTTTIPGAVITTWYRNGKPDTKAPAVTNYLHNIVGAEQKNPLQALAEQWRESAEQWKTAATNTQARVERVAAALDERRAEYIQKRDAAALPTTKAIYQAFIDAIDGIKQRLGVEG